MKLPTLPLSLALVFVCLFSAQAQKRKPTIANTPTLPVVRGSGKIAVVIDESLSLLRMKPSLFADSIQRMRRGRRVQILGFAEADGVLFYKVSAPRGSFGWMQSDSVFGKFRATDEERFARLVLASDGFDQVELAAAFLGMYPASRFRVSVLLLYGDLLENAAAKLSRDAGSRLSRREMAASGAPLHSYYLNFRMLDRYRRLGVTFLFNSFTRTFHYNGASWLEIVRKHSASTESAEAQKRLDSLKLNLERGRTD
ncbi:MAG TPA: SH3 domain-containing protein [Pyrinomonadaceae bacterium]|nr:SH3 domain-containing protein [Pyrinomonadaceae bacterium]